MLFNHWSDFDTDRSFGESSECDFFKSLDNIFNASRASTSMRIITHRKSGDRGKTFSCGSPTKILVISLPKKKVLKPPPIFVGRNKAFAT